MIVVLGGGCVMDFGGGGGFGRGLWWTEGEGGFV